MQAARDFKDECEALYALVKDLPAAHFEQATQFKAWTIGDVFGHLHIFNIAAHLTLTDPEGFATFMQDVFAKLSETMSHRGLTRDYFQGKSGQEIMKIWADYYPAMAADFEAADQDRRVQWAGPDMSVRSCIIARQMEHWSHAQAIYDLLGETRTNGARLKNVAHIGVTTYSWSFKVNGVEPPRPKPYVELVGPQGQIWTWNDPQEDNCVKGQAVEFCRVVTQCRNIADTDLLTLGPTAMQWMATAQCFAGPKEKPPAPGTRHITQKG